jgi:hypothetical protein
MSSFVRAMYLVFQSMVRIEMFPLAEAAAVHDWIARGEVFGRVPGWSARS